MKIKGIDTTSIVKINGITIASIVKISGVTLPAISSYSTPLVSSGLILELDAGNTSSYPGTGTAWTDLSGNSNDCTLYNSPTYISSYSGSIQFDGANDYGYTPVTIEAAANSNLQSFGAWMYGTGADHHWFGSDAAGYGAHHLIVVIDPYWGSQPSPNLVYGGSYYGGGGESNVEYDVTGIINSGGWNYVCVVKTAAYTYDVYFNGIKVMANVYRNSVSNTHLQFGTFWSGFYMPSQLSMVHSYNRALNSTEVLANYNATKYRYSPRPTNVFDAGNTSSYPGTGATWYNVSGSNDATLYNSIAYDGTDGGGCLVFDGTSNYGVIPYDSTFDFSSGNYTINSWVKFNNFGNSTITSKDTSGANFDWCMFLPTSDSIYNYSNGTATNVNVTVGPPLDPSTWYLITISSNSGYISIYVNGVQYGSATYMSISNNDTTALTLGAVSWNSPSLYLDGKLAVIEYYNAGITATETLIYFNNTKTRFGY